MKLIAAAVLPFLPLLAVPASGFDHVDAVLGLAGTDR